MEIKYLNSNTGGFTLMLKLSGVAVPENWFPNPSNGKAVPIKSARSLIAGMAKVSNKE